MPKTNAAGVPTYYDARGTDETAVSATGEVHSLDPTVDDEFQDRDDLTIEGDDAEQYETREQRTQREEREVQERERNEQDAGGEQSSQDEAGTSSKGSSKRSVKTIASS